MVFQVKGKESLDARLNVRLPAGELARIKDDAEMSNMSMSEIVRCRYFGKPVIAKHDELMIKELRRVGGLLKLVHTESNGSYSKETAAALSQVSNLIKELSAK